MRMKLAVAVAVMSAVVSGDAVAASKWDPWAYCWARTKDSKQFIVSAPTQIAGSDYNGIADAWKAFAAGKLGGALDRAECRWAYSEEAAPQALQMQIDEWKAENKPVEMTGWVWGR